MRRVRATIVAVEKQ